MGCEDGVVAAEASKHTLQGAEKQEAQVSDEAMLLRRIWSRGDASNALSVVKPGTSSSRRAGSVEFVEYVLPYEEICKGGGGKPFWKNLRFWQRTSKGAAACGAGRKVTRAKREMGRPPLYTDGNFPYSGSRRPDSQQYYAVVDPQALYMYGRSDGNMCAYVPLKRYPSGPLYLP